MTPIEENMIVFAARYAHGRNTGAALQVVKHILNVWDELSYRTKDHLISESNEASYCLDEWEMLRTKVNKKEEEK